MADSLSLKEAVTITDAALAAYPQRINVVKALRDAYSRGYRAGALAAHASPNPPPQGVLRHEVNYCMRGDMSQRYVHFFATAELADCYANELRERYGTKAFVNRYDRFWSPQFELASWDHLRFHDGVTPQ